MLNKLNEYLSSVDPTCRLYIYDNIDSTNNRAKRIFTELGCENALIVSKAQTEGRGSNGRSFYSPDGNGIYMTLLINKQIPIDKVTLFTPLAAVAVFQALKKENIESLKIKPINDIYKNGKKVCGILCESSTENSKYADYVIIGIGINLTKPKDGYPQEIKNIADSVFKELPNEQTVCNIILQIVKFILSHSDLSDYELIKKEYLSNLL